MEKKSFYISSAATASNMIRQNPFTPKKKTALADITGLSKETTKLTSELTEIIINVNSYATSLTKDSMLKI